MSIQNSINFISDINVNPDFRQFLNKLNPTDVVESLKMEGYEFTQYEFEESINLLHVKCQFEEQADKLFEIVSWYKMLVELN